MRKLAYLADADTGTVQSALNARAKNNGSVFTDGDLLLAMQAKTLSDQQRELYSQQLDAYRDALDIAEIEALTEREELLSQAYVLPDGTRVFFGKDGQTAINEAGEAVDPSLFAGVSMADREPHKLADQYLQNHANLDAIKIAKEKVAKAEESLSDPDLSTAELALIDRDLKSSVLAATEPYPSATFQLDTATAALADDLDIPEFDDEELDLIERGLTSTPAPAPSFNLASSNPDALESPAQPPTPDPKDVPNIDLSF